MSNFNMLKNLELCRVVCCRREQLYFLACMGVWIKGNVADGWVFQVGASPDLKFEAVQGGGHYKL